MQGVFSDAVYTDTEATQAVWTLASAGFVLLGIVGHTLFESGASRPKNSQFILIKNIVVMAMAAVGWYVCGYGIAYGDPQQFAGSNSWLYASAGFEKVKQDHYVTWIFDYSQLALCAVLFTGPLAERT